MSFLKRTLFIAALVLGANAGASSLWQKVMVKVGDLSGCAAQLVEEPYKSVMRDHADRELELTDLEQGARFTLNLGRQFGAGFFGGFYAVTGTSLSSLSALPFAFGVKVPHVHDLTGWVMPNSVKEADREWELYERLQVAIPSIESQANFPKLHAWREGRLPIVPIVASYKTNKGRMLFKPILSNGVFLSQLADVYQKTGSLEKKYVDAIREVYELVQAIHSATGISPDIRPPNWIYIDDPATLEIFGLNRAGFVLVEMSQVPGNFPKYIVPSNSFESFLQEFIGYLKPKK